MDIGGEELLKTLMVTYRLTGEKLNYITAEKLRVAANGSILSKEETKKLVKKEKNKAYRYGSCVFFTEAKKQVCSKMTSVAIGSASSYAGKRLKKDIRKFINKNRKYLQNKNRGDK